MILKKFACGYGQAQKTNIPAEDPTNSCSPVTSSWRQAHAQTSVYQNVAKLRHSHVTSVYQNVIGVLI